MSSLGKAEVWYNKQLLGPFQIGLRIDCNDIKEWCEALKTKFKGLPAVLLDAYKMTRYNVGNVRQCIDLIDYVQTMILHAQSAGIPKELCLVALVIYHHIDGPLL